MSEPSGDPGAAAGSGPGSASNEEYVARMCADMEESKAKRQARRQAKQKAKKQAEVDHPEVLLVLREEDGLEGRREEDVDAPDEEDGWEEGGDSDAEASDDSDEETKERSAVVPEGLRELAGTVRNQLERRSVYTALRTMSKLPNFNHQFLHFLHKRVGAEAKAAASSLSEGRPTELTREALARFQFGRYYDDFHDVAPTITTALVAASTRGTFSQVKEPTRPGLGRAGPGVMVDMRPAIVHTGARLLGFRHPRLVTTVRALRTLYNGVTHLPGRHVKFLNHLGDCFSKKTSLQLQDAVSEDHDAVVIKWKEEVESLWLGPMATASPRARQREALKRGITGFGFFGDNVGIKVVRRFNTGLENANKYLNMTASIVKKNQVSSAHCSDEPMCAPSDIDYFPDAEAIGRMEQWMLQALGKILVENVPGLKSCKKYLQTPDYEFKTQMSRKSECFVLDITLADPNTTAGMTEVLLMYKKYCPLVSECGEVGAKMAVHGDQGFLEKARGAVLDRTAEKNLKERLSALVTVPQEFHAEKENLLCMREEFDLYGQVMEPGSFSHVKAAFGHKKADRKLKNFFPNWNLAYVTTAINLLSLYFTETGRSHEDESDLALCSDDFYELLNGLLGKFNLLRWRWLQAEDRSSASDEFLGSRLDLIHHGIILLARHLAVQHGAGCVVVDFWRDSLFAYNRRSKYKYRIEAHQKIAKAGGAFGRRIALDSTFNCFVNDSGMKNGCKGGDLKVEHINDKVKERFDRVAGNYTIQAIRRISRTMDIAGLLEEKLAIPYLDEAEGDATTGPRLGKRKGQFQDQVHKGVVMMGDSLKYIDGRKYVAYRDAAEKKAYERETRGKSREPEGHKKMTMFIKERNGIMAGVIRATRETPGKTDMERESL